MNIFKRENKAEKEIENLTSQIDRLSKKLNLLKAKTFKSTIDLRANIKNELKARRKNKVSLNELKEIIDKISGEKRLEMISK